MSGVKKLKLEDSRSCVHSFVFEHALNLLRLQEKTGKSGWKLKEAKWKFENNEICRRTNSTGSKESTK